MKLDKTAIIIKRSIDSRQNTLWCATHPQLKDLEPATESLSLLLTTPDALSLKNGLIYLTSLCQDGTCWLESRWRGKRSIKNIAVMWTARNDFVIATPVQRFISDCLECVEPCFENIRLSQNWQSCFSSSFIFGFFNRSFCSCQTA